MIQDFKDYKFHLALLEEMTKSANDIKRNTLKVKVDGIDNMIIQAVLAAIEQGIENCQKAIKEFEKMHLN